MEPQRVECPRGDKPSSLTVLSRVISFATSQTNDAAGRALRHGISTGLVEIDHVSIAFGKGRHAHKAVEETSIRVEPGEFICILGPSGCGKSTLLNTVAGYVTPHSGEVRVDGELITGPGPDRGWCSAVFAFLEDRERTSRSEIAGKPRTQSRTHS
jgi:NitT/TauT family transport system ATP-binding protein